MAKRCAFLLAGLALLSTTVGCCHSCLGRGYGSPCGSPCATGGCQPSYYPPAGGGAYYQGYGSTALNGTFGTTAYNSDPAVMTASPIMAGPTYSTTALAPINTLPTY